MRAQAPKGHLDGMLLAALEDGPRHGYAVMEALRAGSGGQFDLPTGTIYPALRRLAALPVAVAATASLTRLTLAARATRNCLTARAACPAPPGWPRGHDW